MPAKRFKYVPHTADVAFVAYGKNFEAALESAAMALLNLMLDVKKVRAVHAKSIVIVIDDEASTKEDLVWYFLQDVLSKIDAEKLNAYDFKMHAVKESHAKFKASGRLLCKDTGADFALLSLKAITPHDLVIRSTAKGCSISVVADV